MTIIEAVILIFLEWKIANLMAVPGYLIHFLDCMFWFVDYLYLGHHGRGNLACGVMAMTLFNLCAYFLEGFLSAQDIFIFQSKQKEKHEKIWMYISLIYVMIMTILAVLLLIVFDMYLYQSMELKNNVIFKTVMYGWFLLPAFFLHGVQRIIQQYFSIKSLYVPIIISMLVGLVVNICGK